MKRTVWFLAGCISLSLTLTPSPAWASNGVVTLGQNLTAGQKDMMLRQFGVSGQSVSILTVNNQDEHRLLDGIAPASEIGTRSISCAYVVDRGPGYGIRVSTRDITWVTPSMYASALATAGVKNAKVSAAAPFPVSGTAALAGIIMAYQKASGTAIPISQARTAAKEMVVTGQLGQSIHDKNKATELILMVKKDVVSHHLTSASAIRPVVVQWANRLSITLSAQQIDQITRLMVDISGLSINSSALESQLSGVERQIGSYLGPSFSLHNIILWLRELWHRLLGAIHSSWIDVRRLFSVQ